MRDLLRLVFIAGFFFFGWKYWESQHTAKTGSPNASTSASSFSSTSPTPSSSGGTTDELGTIIESIFSPTVSPDFHIVRAQDPSVALYKILGTYSQRAKNGEAFANQVIGFCRDLSIAYGERKKSEEALEHFEREVWVGSSYESASMRRQAFINGEIARWERYRDNTKPDLLRRLGYIKSLER